MLTNKFVLAVAAGFLTIGLSACTALSEYGQSSYYNQSSSASKAENTVDAEDADGIITVSIENFAFVPAQLTVRADELIRAQVGNKQQLRDLGLYRGSSAVAADRHRVPVQHTGGRFKPGSPSILR